MKEAALILIATFAFAGVAFTAGRPTPPVQCPATTEVVRYLDVPMPQPIYPPPRLLPVTEMGPRLVEKVAVAAEAETEDPEPIQRRHRHRRHHRRHR